MPDRQSPTRPRQAGRAGVSGIRSAGIATVHRAIGMSGRIAASIGWLPFPIAVAWSDPEQTFEAANGAADHPADSPTDRARRVVSEIRAMGGTFRNALRLRRKRRRKRCDQGGC